MEPDVESANEPTDTAPRAVRITAYLLMAVFVVATSVGVALTFGTGWGLVSLGLTCGAYGLLLGAE